MKILEQVPKPPEGWWIGMQAKCAWCETRVQLEVSDKIHEDIDQRGWYALFNCPLCNKPVSVKFADKD